MPFSDPDPTMVRTIPSVLVVQVQFVGTVPCEPAAEPAATLLRMRFVRASSISRPRGVALAETAASMVGINADAAAAHSICGAAMRMVKSTAAPLATVIPSRGDIYAIVA
jgi:hypothetical protein